MLGLLDEYAPVVWDGQFAVERGWLFAGFNVDGDVEFAFGAAAEDAVGWGDIGVVAPHRGADVSMVGDEVIGGIEADPTEVGQQDIDPGVGGIGGGAVMVFAAAIEIAGDVAGGDADMAEQGDHGVGKVLANALAADDGFVDGGVDAGGAGLVIEVVVEALVELLDEHEGVVAAGDAHLGGKECEGGGFEAN